MKEEIQYRRITNINPICGVTGTQLYDQCQYLIDPLCATNTIFQVLDDDTIQIAVHDTVKLTMKSMESGKVNKYDYEQFKMYLYSTFYWKLKTAHRKHIGVHTKNTGLTLEYLDVFHNDVIDDAMTFEDIDQNNQKIKLLHQAINNLPQLERSIITDYINDIPIVQLKNKYCITDAGFRKIIALLRFKLNKGRDPLSKIRDSRLVYAGSKPHTPRGKGIGKKTKLENDLELLKENYPNEIFLTRLEINKKYFIGTKGLRNKIKRQQIKYKDKYSKLPSGGALYGLWISVCELDRIGIITKEEREELKKEIKIIPFEQTEEYKRLKAIELDALGKSRLEIRKALKCSPQAIIRYLGEWKYKPRPDTHIEKMRVITKQIKVPKEKKIKVAKEKIIKEKKIKLPRITTKEQIIQLINEGKTRKEIVSILKISHKTIIKHIGKTTKPISMHSKYKDEILKLRSEGKSYRQISKILNCAKSTIAYHLHESVREQSRITNKKNKALRKNKSK